MSCSKVVTRVEISGAKPVTLLFCPPCDADYIVRHTDGGTETEWRLPDGRAALTHRGAGRSGTGKRFANAVTTAAKWTDSPGYADLTAITTIRRATTRLTLESSARFPRRTITVPII